ncbi:MAG: tRNA preQ1(34) S-adenosylmethionine ribosyltransferase-isomerase QueA [Candidatus Thioglobus autotrophicus]|nr:tRNA preQ1(34) S-adenosylmethionine ribosyltransferase-isomerase QueA [Candidatus Thioglobus autotrophicus]
MKLSDFDFDLPNSLIAQYPSEKRTDSRLLVVQDDFINTTFSQLGEFLKPKDLLILNDTKVIPARLFGRKESGGKVEILVERLINDFQALVMIKASRAPKIDSYIVLENDKRVRVCDKDAELYKLSFGSNSILTLLNEIGHVPLPPYIERIDGKEDLIRYQTVYAKNDGAVAAPTAGLHFDEPLLSNLNSYGVNHAFVTLHVGAGTFQPVKVEDIKDHQMHSEYFEVCQETVDKIVTTKANGGRIVAVGTTAVRTLESIALQGKLSSAKGDTDIFIYPGFEFRLVDAMITNFHLPKSSLLMLVSAFIGIEKMFQIYQYAIEEKYRFFSYGDAMLLEKKL